MEPAAPRAARAPTAPTRGRLRLAGRCAVVPAIQPPERASDWGVFLLGNPGPALRRVSRGNPRRAPVAVSRPSPAEAEAPAAPGPRAVARGTRPEPLGENPPGPDASRRTLWPGRGTAWGLQPSKADSEGRRRGGSVPSGRVPPRGPQAVSSAPAFGGRPARSRRSHAWAAPHRARGSGRVARASLGVS